MIGGSCGLRSWRGRTCFVFSLLGMGIEEVGDRRSRKRKMGQKKQGTSNKQRRGGGGGEGKREAKAYQGSASQIKRLMRPSGFTDSETICLRRM